MKVIVEHDKRGKIRSVARIQGGGEVYTSLRARRSHQVTEVDAPHIRDAGDHTGLAGLRQHFSVQISPKGANLVPVKPVRKKARKKAR